MENNKIPGETNADKPTSIFSEEDFNLEGYDKHIRQARNAIFAAAILLGLAIILLAITTYDTSEYLWIDIVIYSIFIVGFVLLGLWTKKKPYSAIIGAIILYALFILLNAVVDYTTIFKGIIIKIIIIVLLVKGLRDAKEAQERRNIISK